MAAPASSGPVGPVDDEEPLDPGVKVELDILNQCACDVNRLEREVDEARGKYQQNFSACSQQLERLKKKLGASIKKARPYYELKEKAREAQSEALRSARKFQSANGVYLAAKETISLAELRLMDDKAASLSSAWQEMLNHALLRVMEAEQQKSASEREHLDRAAAFADIEKQMVIHENKQKRSIAKARIYFETKKELEIKLQQVKQSIQDLQQAMASAKGRYSSALRRLEAISDCIHEQRQQQLVLMYPRQPGVGAEQDDWEEQKLPTLSTCDIDGSENNDDSYEYDMDEDDDDYDDIDSDSVFRTRILTASLDEEDTSCAKPPRARGKKKQLKRSQSLPVNASQLARRQRGVEGLTPLSDRAEACPPDGESMGSGTSVGACSVSSVSSQGLHDHSEKLEDSSITSAGLEAPLSDISGAPLASSEALTCTPSFVLGGDLESSDSHGSGVKASCSPSQEQQTSLKVPTEPETPSLNIKSATSSQAHDLEPSISQNQCPEMSSSHSSDDVSACAHEPELETSCATTPEHDTS